MFQAIRDQDRSLLIGLVTLVMAVVLVANALADVLTAVHRPAAAVGAGPPLGRLLRQAAR